MKPLPLLLLAVIVIPFPGLNGSQEGTSDLDAAYQRFLSAPIETQREVLEEITDRLRVSGYESVRTLIDMIDRAREELPVIPDPGPAFHDPGTYSPGLWPRRFLDAEDSGVQLQSELFRPWDSKPSFAAGILYDFGRNSGLDPGEEVPPGQLLFDVLRGYAPGSDCLLAWIEWKLDHDKEIDKLALHFGHAYCDLDGGAFPGVTIYDALASGETIAMPDVDVIAYARNILNDHSFKSPIPDDERLARLYEDVRGGYLRLFKYRTLIDAIAEIYLNPEAPLRPEHEPLRDRISYMLDLDECDFDRIRERLETVGTREGWIRDIDDLVSQDMQWNERIESFKAYAVERQWAVALAAQEGLRERGLPLSLPKPRSMIYSSR